MGFAGPALDGDPRQLGVPSVSVPPGDAPGHFAFLGHFARIDAPASTAVTEAVLGWSPTGPTLLDDLDAGHYTATAPAD